MPTTLTPETLDQAAAQLLETAAWQQIVTHWTLTAPEPPATVPNPAPRPLLTKSTADLEREAAIIYGPAPRDRQLPGRLAAILPDRLQQWRGAFKPDLKPSVQLGYARLVLTEWGWQNQPYRLRNTAGARCICGAILTAHRLGYGTEPTMHTAAGFVLAELRHQSWTGLIGPWNRAPGRTVHQALALLDAAAARAAGTGH